MYIPPKSVFSKRVYKLETITPMLSYFIDVRKKNHLYLSHMGVLWCPKRGCKAPESSNWVIKQICFISYYKFNNRKQSIENVFSEVTGSHHSWSDDISDASALWIGLCEHLQKGWPNTLRSFLGILFWKQNYWVSALFLKHSDLEILLIT